MSGRPGSTSRRNPPCGHVARAPRAARLAQTHPRPAMRDVSRAERVERVLDAVLSQSATWLLASVTTSTDPSPSIFTSSGRARKLKFFLELLAALGERTLEVHDRDVGRLEDRSNAREVERPQPLLWRTGGRAADRNDPEVEAERGVPAGGDGHGCAAAPQARAGKRRHGVARRVPCAGRCALARAVARDQRGDRCAQALDQEAAAIHRVTAERPATRARARPPGAPCAPLARARARRAPCAAGSPDSRRPPPRDRPAAPRRACARAAPRHLWMGEVVDAGAPAAMIGVGQVHHLGARQLARSWRGVCGAPSARGPGDRGRGNRCAADAPGRARSASARARLGEADRGQHLGDVAHPVRETPPRAGRRGPSGRPRAATAPQPAEVVVMKSRSSPKACEIAARQALRVATQPGVRMQRAAAGLGMRRHDLASREHQQAHRLVVGAREHRLHDAGGEVADARLGSAGRMEDQGVGAPLDSCAWRKPRGDRIQRACPPRQQRGVSSRSRAAQRPAAGVRAAPTA